jgi:hypothetical protein
MVSPRNIRNRWPGSRTNRDGRKSLSLCLSSFSLLQKMEKEGVSAVLEATFDALPDIDYIVFQMPKVSDHLFYRNDRGPPLFQSPISSQWNLALSSLPWTRAPSSM